MKVPRCTVKLPRLFPRPLCFSIPGHHLWPLPGGQAPTPRLRHTAGGHQGKLSAHEPASHRILHWENHADLWDDASEAWFHAGGGTLRGQNQCLSCAGRSPSWRFWKGRMSRLDLRLMLWKLGIVVHWITITSKEVDESSSTGRKLSFSLLCYIIPYVARSWSIATFKHFIFLVAFPLNILKVKHTDYVAVR